MIGDFYTTETMEMNPNSSTLNGLKSFLMSYTKGLCHDKDTGLVKDPNHYLSFVKAIESGDLWEFENIPLGPVCAPDNNNQLVPEWMSLKALGGNPNPNHY